MAFNGTHMPGLGKLALRIGRHFLLLVAATVVAAGCFEFAGIGDITGQRGGQSATATGQPGADSQCRWRSEC